MQKPPSTKVGDIYISKGGDRVVVSEYITSKKMKIKFEDGTEISAMQGNLNKGAFKHPMRNKFPDGFVFITKLGDTVEVIKTVSSSEIHVKWEDGVITTTDTRGIKDKSVKHPTRHDLEVGSIHHLHFDNEDVEVIEYISSTNLTIQFKDGNTVKTTKTLLLEGAIRHPTKGVRIGQKFLTNSGYEGTVTGYKSAHVVEVLWQDGSSSIESTASIKIGSIKPLMQPSLCDVGFFGDGRFKPFDKHKSNKEERIQAYWSRMISRCYSPREMNKSKGASYRDIHVVKDWYNFQNFAEWADVQYNNEDLTFELDKDLLSKNNSKLYSPNDCCFLPPEINSFLMQKEIGKYGRGVHIIKPSKKSPNATVGYVSKLNRCGGRDYLGFYPTPELAFEAYKKAKEAYAKELAEKWEDKIDPRAYEALMAYTVEIT